MAANRKHQGAALWRIGAVTALLVGLLAGLAAGAPAPAGRRLRITAQHGQLSVDVHQADIGAVLAQIGAQAGVHIVWAPPAARQVSAQFSGVELDAGLRHLLRLASLSYVMRYGPGPTGAPVVQEGLNPTSLSPGAISTTAPVWMKENSLAFPMLKFSEHAWTFPADAP
jgi:hypothetical protein